MKNQRLNAPMDSTIGTVADGAIETDHLRKAVAGLACDFSGFAQGDSVNSAYGGGASAGGAQRTNLGVTFSGANVLNDWNGSGSPNPGIVYSLAGQILAQATGGTDGWDAVEFFYSSTAALQLQAWASTDGSGTPTETVSLASNLSSAPYTSWTSRRVYFSQRVKSIRISGPANKWGLDGFTAFQGSPECTYGDYVNLSFNVPVEASNTNLDGDPAYTGTSMRYRNVATVGGRPVDARISVAAVTGAIRWDGHLISIHGNDHGIYYSSTATNNTGSLDCKIEFFEGGGSFTTPIWVPKFRLMIYDLDGQSGSQAEQISVSIPTGQAGFFGYQMDRWVTATSAPGTLTFSGSGTNFPEDGNSAVILHFAGSKEVTMRMSQTKASGNAVDAVYNGIDGDLGMLGDPSRFGALQAVRTPPADCNGNGIVDSCEIANGLATDCNANGALDSCELANGSAVDQNGNGVPDSCDPFPSLTLTANAAACNAVGSVVRVDARLSGVLNLVVAGQLVLNWDASKLQLLSAGAGDAPYTTNYMVNNAAGQAVILVSSSPGGTGTTAPAVIVSRLQFQVLGGSCDGSGTAVTFNSYGPLSTEFTDGTGRSIVPTLIGSSGFVVDDGAPVLSNVPANVTVQAQAGEGAFAIVAIGAPTATDACVPGLTATGVRSDGRPMGAAWPVGTTTVSWSASDPCGNVTGATTLVTVLGYNTIDLSANWGTGYGWGATRSMKVSVLGSMGAQNRVVPATMNAAGKSAWSITDLPVDTYSCATIEDPARSLQRRVTVSDTGSVWTAAEAALVLGDIIDDEVIDVLDWGAYVVRKASSDLNGDGVIDSTDGNIILANFGRQGDLGCGNPFDGPRAPITAITVAELVEMGMPELAGADLNGDGWVDAADMGLFDG